MHSQPALTGLLSRPNRLTGAALLLLSALAWLQLFRSGPAAGVAVHHSHAGHFLADPELPTWGPVFASTVFLMWVLMAIAMMLPTAAPAILTFADIAHAGEQAGSPGARIAAFIVGYLAAWGAFGALATAAQWNKSAASVHSWSAWRSSVPGPINSQRSNAPVSRNAAARLHFSSAAGVTAQAALYTLVYGTASTALAAAGR